MVFWSMLRACASMSSQWTSKFPAHVMEKEGVLWMGWPWLPLSQASKVSEVVKRPFIRAPFWPGGNHAWDWGFQLSQGHHLLSQGHSQSRVIRGYYSIDLRLRLCEFGCDFPMPRAASSTVVSKAIWAPKGSAPSVLFPIVFVSSFLKSTRSA
jgi:hypothetical protein